MGIDAARLNPSYGRRLLSLFYGLPSLAATLRAVATRR